MTFLPVQKTMSMNLCHCKQIPSTCSSCGVIPSLASQHAQHRGRQNVISYSTRSGQMKAYPAKLGLLAELQGCKADKVDVQAVAEVDSELTEGVQLQGRQTGLGKATREANTQECQMSWPSTCSALLLWLWLSQGRSESCVTGTNATLELCNGVLESSMGNCQTGFSGAFKMHAQSYTRSRYGPRSSGFQHAELCRDILHRPPERACLALSADRCLYMAHILPREPSITEMSGDFNPGFNTLQLTSTEQLTSSEETSRRTHEVA